MLKTAVLHNIFQDSLINRNIKKLDLFEVLFL